MSSRILVVEDEAHLAEGIRVNLEAEGYEVEVAGDGLQGLIRFQAGGIDLIVLDVMLPHKDGFTVCQEIRASGSKVPILFLTAKNTADDRIYGLEIGGDDYLGKPFHLKELLLRIKGMVERQQWYVETPSQGDHIAVGDHQVDFRSYEVTDPGGEREFLPQKEVMLLKILVERVGEVVSRDEILDYVWGYDVFPSTRTVDNFIVRLRKRFEPDPAQPRYFHTVRGVGYRYTPEGADE